jgi:hypothetical protein
MDDHVPHLSADELTAEIGELLPDKEVFSLLDLFVNLDLAIDLAAPVDLAVAANANVVAPIDAAVAANVLSLGSTAQALADQGVLLDQHISGDAIADAPQQATIDQSNDVIDPGTGTVTDPVGTDPVGTDPVGTITEGGALDGPLLNVNVDVALDADLAAPVAGAVAANANVAAPIDAAVAANVASIDSSATAVAEQDAIITQDLDGVTAHATAARRPRSPSSPPDERLILPERGGNRGSGNRNRRPAGVDLGGATA